jgi:hypothetical protein
VGFYVFGGKGVEMVSKLFLFLSCFITILLSFFSIPFLLAATYQYVETINMNDYDVDDLDSDGSNLIALYGGWPANSIGTFDLSGNLIDSFNTLGAFNAGVTFNGSNFVFSGDQSYDGLLSEMKPSDGSIFGPLGDSGWSQPYLAFDGSNILASGPASGANGILKIPINKLDSIFYINVGSISVTVDTGTTASGVSRSVIAWHDGDLFVALSIGGTNKVYQFDSNLDLIQEIPITQIISGQAIKALTFVGEDLFVANYSVNEIYRYTPERDITVTSPNGGENLFVGDTFEITWTSEGDIDFVKIEYSVNNGIDWTEIKASTYNDGSYDWIVPNDISDQCQVRISDEEDEVSDVSNDVFSIMSKQSTQCSDFAGNWSGTWSETYCDGLDYSGTWTGQVYSDCSFIGTPDGLTVTGTIDPSTGIFTGSGTSEVCGSITLDGDFIDDSVTGSYSYSSGGGGSFIGSFQSTFDGGDSGGDGGGDGGGGGGGGG